MKHKKSSLTIMVFAGSMMLATGSWAQGSRAEEPIRYRQAVMTMVKRHYDKVSAMAKGRVPFNREELGNQAAVLEMLSRLSLDGFVVGSHEGQTKARPEIWQDWPKFRASGEKFQADAAKLKEVAKKGNPDTLKQAVAEMTKTCKACHDDFKTSAE